MKHLLIVYHTKTGNTGRLAQAALEGARGGLESARGGLDDVRGGLDDVRGGLDDVRGGLDDVRGGLDDARGEEAGPVEVRFLTAARAGPRDLLWADGLLLGTPENLGYMSGAMKDFLDRTFYEVEGKLQPLPCGIFISAGNDGSGALRSLRRIIGGYPFQEVQEPVVAQGTVTEAHLTGCRELGMALAVGLEAGIY